MIYELRIYECVPGRLPDLLHGEGLATHVFRYEFGDICIDRHQLHTDTQPGHHAPEIDHVGGRLECHDRGTDAVPDEGEREHSPPPEPVG